MIAIVSMRMIVNPAGAKVHQVGNHDQAYRGQQQPVVAMKDKLPEYEENKAGNKDNKRAEAVMVPAITMNQRIGTDGQGQQEHQYLK